MVAPQFNGSSLVLIAGIIAAFRRKQAIGGWLFYFFCQVLLGLLLIFTTTHWKRYLPSAWSEPGLYFLFTLSNLSRTILLAEIGLVSVMVIRTREWRWVSGLRYTLIAYAFVIMVKLVVDYFWFPSSIGTDSLSLTFPCVWILYFELSRRVRRVFLDKTW